MKYRIQVTVSGERLSAVIDAAFKGTPGFDPELKVYPANEFAVETPPTAQLAAAKEKPKQMRMRRAPDGRRHEVIGAALKTGPKRWGELRNALKAEGISEHSLNSAMRTWQTNGKIDRGPDGLWRLLVHEQA